MQIINITDAKAHFSAVINQVIAGEDIIIERMGKPVAQIIAYKQKKPKLLGFMKGQVTIPDDFNTWPDEEARLLGIIDDEDQNI